jgi:hypothetical protein
MAGETEDDANTRPSWRRVFTLQVILQILAVSFLAFHMVAFDAFMPTFLAAPSSPDSSREHKRGVMDSNGGFGYGSQKIGLILLSQAIVVLIAQATIVFCLIDWAGPLTACGVVFWIIPCRIRLDAHFFRYSRLEDLSSQ